MRKFRLLTPAPQILRAALEQLGCKVVSVPQSRWIDVELETADLVAILEWLPLIDKCLIPLLDDVPLPGLKQALAQVPWGIHLKNDARVNTSAIGCSGGAEKVAAFRADLRQMITDVTPRNTHRHAFEVPDGLRLAGGEFQGQVNLAIDLTGPEFRKRFGRNLAIDWALLNAKGQRIAIAGDERAVNQVRLAASGFAKLNAEEREEFALWKAWPTALAASRLDVSAYQQQKTFVDVSDHLDSVHSGDSLIWALNSRPPKFTRSLQLMVLGQIDGYRPPKRFETLELGRGRKAIHVAYGDIEVQSDEDGAEIALSEGSKQAFVARLGKCLAKLDRHCKQQQSNAVRVYDRDLPEFALAIDHYAGRWHVAEYAADHKISPALASGRLAFALETLAEQAQCPAHKIAVKRRERQSGTSQYERQGKRNQRFVVDEAPVKFWVNLHDYLDTGLFLDHRKLRRWSAKGVAGKRYLNLFCYTGSASVHAAMAGANTTSVDLSNTYLDWAEDNFKLNELDPAEHQFIQGDVLAWIRECREVFDVIYLDPPSFSNSKRMDSTFDIQRDHVALLQDTLKCLAPDGVLFFSTNRRKFALDPAISDQFQVKDTSRASLPADFERSPGLRSVFEIRHR
ncbi:MAG: class I SAM-dependent methyltransferase [Gammaproteobacteria bacterium]|nr:class I SAM-dependent methyltransferase [Gammaproteobacteria bacterium]